MSLFNLFSKKNDPLKEKIKAIEADIKSTIDAICTEDFWVATHGAYHLDPKNLAFWICVKSDKMKVRLQSSISINNSLRSLLIKHEYPEAARNLVFIVFESQETVDRDFGGRWRHRMQ